MTLDSCHESGTALKDIEIQRGLSLAHVTRLDVLVVLAFEIVGYVCPIKIILLFFFQKLQLMLELILKLTVKLLGAALSKFGVANAIDVEVGLQVHVLTGEELVFLV